MRHRLIHLSRPVNFAATRFSSNMSNTYVKRTTLFKVPKEEDIEKVLKGYEILRTTAVKVENLSLTLESSRVKRS